MTPPVQPKRKDSYSILLAIIILIAVHFSFFWQNFDSIQNKILPNDTDGYCHLLRVEELHQTNRWFDSVLEKSNAPYGEKLHWGRSFDVLLWAGASFFSLFFNFKESLYWWGVFISPLLHLLTMFVLVWSAIPIIGKRFSTLIAYILPFQWIVTGAFESARPDHHSLILFLFSVYIGFNIHILSRSPNRSLSLFSGILASILLWSGIESIVIVFYTIIYFGIIWILTGKEWVHHNFVFSLTLFISSIFFLFFDQTVSEALIPELDNLSIVHIFLLFINSLFWAVIFASTFLAHIFQYKKSRIIAGSAGALICVLLMYYRYPDFFYGPMGNIGPDVLKIYMDRIQEFQSVFDLSFGSFLSSSLVVMVVSLASSSAIYIYHVKSKIKIDYAWTLLLSSLAIYFFLYAYIVRWGYYLQLLYLFPMAKLLSLVLERIELNFGDKTISILRPLAIFFFCSFPISIQILMPQVDLKNEVILNQDSFQHDLYQYLNNDKLFSDKSYRLLTSIWIGPLILYNTNHEIIGTPAHRNVSGILDTYNIMTAEDDKIAKNIIERRGIDLIILTNFDEYKKLNSFYSRLWNSQIPDWLEPQQIPTDLKGKIKVFSVKM